MIPHHQPSADQGTCESPPTALGPAELLTHRRQLATLLCAHAGVRATVAITIVVGAWFGSKVVGIEGLNVSALSLLALIIGAYNVVVWLVSRPDCGRPVTDSDRLRILRVLMIATIVLDDVCLAVAIWLVGGPRSPFLAFFILHVIITALLLSRRDAIITMVLAYALLAGVTVGEAAGVLPPQHPAGAVVAPGPIDWLYGLTVLVVFALLFGLAGLMLTGLSTLLRTGERRLRDANRELARLSALRKDFLQVTTHNIQSPVGAATMFLENLQQGLAGSLDETQSRWVERALDRLQGLNAFLRDLTLLSTVETGELEQRMHPVAVLPLVTELASAYRDQAGQRRHALCVRTEEEGLYVLGIARLIREAVVNYLTNAIKYTPPGGRICVAAMREGDEVVIEVSDNGPGIPPDAQGQLFTELTSIATARGLSAERGTGLGLSLVKRIAELHGGRVSAESKVGVGSTFRIHFPLLRQNDQSDRPPGHPDV